MTDTGARACCGLVRQSDPGVRVRALGVSSVPTAFFFFFSSRRRHTRCPSDWSSDVCSSDLSARSSWSAVPLRTNRTVFQPMWGTLSGGASLKRTPRPGKTPSPVTPPSSDELNSACMPRHTPRKGRSCSIHPLTVASRPEERSAKTQSLKAPTPGSTRPHAPHSSASAGVRTTTGDAPTASSAFVTLRRLQMPVSMTATRALIVAGSKAALGAREEVRRARLDLGGGVKGPSQALEDRLRDVVGLIPAYQVYVQVRAKRVAEGPAKLLHEDKAEVPDEHR